MNRQLALIMDLQARLSELTCPGCGHEKLQLTLRCDAHAEACTFVVRCGSCRIRLFVDLDGLPSAARRDGAHACISRVLCPGCGSADCTVKFRCDASMQRCVYEVACTACRQAGRDSPADRQ